MKIRNSTKVMIAGIVLALLAAGGAAGCNSTPSETGKVGVAVSILPQAEFMERIGGDKVDVTVMVPPGASPHSYEPAPSQLTALSKAAMYAKVGSGVEFELTWMDKLIAQNQDMLVVDCSQGIQLLDMTVGEEAGTKDPHIWMSPVNAETMVKNITDGLIKVDPDNQSYYEKNRDDYLAELAQLDTDIRSGLEGVTNRTFMVYHPSFGYFAAEYNLTMLAIEDEGKEPTASGILHLIDEAKSLGIKVIFVEPQFNPQSAEVIANEIGGSVIYIDPLARDYLENLRSMSSELISTLKSS